MDRSEFLIRLKKKGIDPQIVSFDSSTKDGCNIRKNRLGWEVFMRERGKEYDNIGFPSESDALQYLYDELVKYTEMGRTDIDIQTSDCRAKTEVKPVQENHSGNLHKIFCRKLLTMSNERCILHPSKDSDASEPVPGAASFTKFTGV